MSANTAGGSDTTLLDQFAKLGVPQALQQALIKQGISVPTPIQDTAIPLILSGKEIYLHAETGTGKTLAFLVPLFVQTDPLLPYIQAVIIAPTHELALQIQKQSLDLAQNSGLPIRTLLLIGGTAKDRQIEKLKKKPHIVVGSPGRIAELIAEGRLKTHKVKSIVVDEADRLLCDENITDIRAIIKAAPSSRQLLFASATQKTESDEILQALSPNLEVVSTGSMPVNPLIEHYFIVCEERDKPDVMRSMLHAFAPTRALIFVHRNETAEIVSAKLAHHKLAVADLHGAYDKEDRKLAMEQIRSGKVIALIASDVAARGLDIKGVSHVFNLDAPSDSKAYLHRVGRTGRAGAKGVAVTVLTEQQLRLVRRFEEDLGISFKETYLRKGEVHIEQS